MKYLFPGKSEKKIPFQIKIALLEPLKSRAIVNEVLGVEFVKAIPPEVAI